MRIPEAVPTIPISSPEKEPSVWAIRTSRANRAPKRTIAEPAATSTACLGEPHFAPCNHATRKQGKDSGPHPSWGGQGGDALKPFWKRLRASGAKIEAVATDMSPAYIDAVTTHLPEATLVFDRFHVIKLYNDKLSELRRRLVPPTYRHDAERMPSRASAGCC